MMEIEEDPNIYILRIQELARDPNSKEYFAANKYLLEEPWKKTKVGRPSKDAIEYEARRLVEDQEKIKHAYERIRDALQENDPEEGQVRQNNQEEE